MDVVKESLVRAAGFTFLMVLLGILVGLQMDDMRQDHLSEELRQSNLETETFLVLQSYLDGSGENYCELIDLRADDVSERSAELGSELEQLSGQAISDSEYNYIRDRYYNNQLRLYMILKEYRERCDSGENTVLYFFDGGMQSQRQGEVLDEVVQNNGVHVFSFNLEVEDSPVIDVLERDYNVTETPTLVVNGEKFEGFVSAGELQNEVLE